jgi:large subunit ribosomal protein L18
MNKNKEKIRKRVVRHRRVTATLQGTAEVPRLNVFRSNQHIYAQLVDDETGKTLLSTHDLKTKVKGTKKEVALAVGKELGEKAKESGIKNVVFDRGGFKYHGRVAAIAVGAREAGLKF